MRHKSISICGLVIHIPVSHFQTQWCELYECLALICTVSCVTKLWEMLEEEEFSFTILKNIILPWCLILGVLLLFFFMFSHHNYILIILRWKHMFVETCLCLRCLTSLYVACKRKCKPSQKYFEWTSMCILILSAHLCLVLPIGLFPSVFCTKKPVYICLLLTF